LPLPAQENEDEFTLDEIIVTAEKREENVQKTPISIAVISADEIKDKSLTSVDTILDNIVGVQIQGQGTGAQIFIRGIGLNNLDTAYGDPAIALNVDGIQQQRGGAIGQSTMDIERIEVLRGPQGTLYGRNATGGAVNVVMVQPKDKFETSARVQIGNYDVRTYEAMVNIPIYSKLALRVSGIRDGRSTYMSGPLATGEQNQTTARLKAQFKPSDDFTLSGTIEYRKDKSTGGFASVPVSNLEADDPWYNPATTTGGPGGGSTNWSESWNYSLTVNWNIMDWAVFTFIPAISTNETHFTMRAGSMEPPPPYPKGSQTTYEARLSNASDSRITWTMGAFLWDSSVSNADQPAPNRAGLQIQQLDRPTNAWAMFGQMTYPFTDAFRGVAGFRYNNDKRTQQYRIIMVDEDLNIVDDSGIKTLGQSVAKPTFKAGLEYDLAQDSMVYLQASSGYKSGGVTFNYLIDTETGEFTHAEEMKFDEETSMSYEFGSKNRFLNNRLQVNGAVYLTVYEGAQVMMWKRIVEDEDPILYIGNAGPSNMYGAEIETTYLLTKRDQMNVNVSSMKGEYTDLTVEYDSPAWAGGGDNPPLTLDNTPMANMPRLNLQLGYRHTFDLGDYGTFAATVDTNYKTKYYNNIETNIEGAEVPSHHISNLYLSWSSPKGMWSASAFVKNIENKAIARMATKGGGPNPTPTVMLNAPRTYGAALTLKY